MEPVMVITVPTLYENGGVTEAFGEHFPAYVIKVNPLTDVTPSILDGGVAVHIGHATETKPVGGRVRIRESVYDKTGTRCLERFTDAYVEFIVCDGTPVLWFVICDRGHV